jgi:hypothetical protein
MFVSVTIVRVGEIVAARRYDGALEGDNDDDGDDDDDDSTLGSSIPAVRGGSTVSSRSETKNAPNVALATSNGTKATIIKKCRRRRRTSSLMTGVDSSVCSSRFLDGSPPTSLLLLLLLLLLDEELWKVSSFTTTALSRIPLLAVDDTTSNDDIIPLLITFNTSNKLRTNVVIALAGSFDATIPRPDLKISVKIWLRIWRQQDFLGSLVVE